MHRNLVSVGKCIQTEEVIVNCMYNIIHRKTSHAVKNHVPCE